MGRDRLKAWIPAFAGTTEEGFASGGAYNLLTMHPTLFVGPYDWQPERVPRVSSRSHPGSLE